MFLVSPLLLNSHVEFQFIRFIWDIIEYTLCTSTTNDRLISFTRNVGSWFWRQCKHWKRLGQWTRLLTNAFQWRIFMKLFSDDRQLRWLTSDRSHHEVNVQRIICPSEDINDYRSHPWLLMGRSRLAYWNKYTWMVSAVINVAMLNPRRGIV